VALALLTVGGYLVEEQFANPVQDQSAALLFAALLIATATLLYFLLHSSRRLRHHVFVASVPRLWEENPLVVARGSTGARGQNAGVPLPGRFVDRTVIRIQR
jgi:hypothetical protein